MLNGLLQEIQSLVLKLHARSNCDSLAEPRTPRQLHALCAPVLLCVVYSACSPACSLYKPMWPLPSPAAPISSRVYTHIPVVALQLHACSPSPYQLQLVLVTLWLLCVWVLQRHVGLCFFKTPVGFLVHPVR